MSEYWKSTPKYWCKHCKSFIRDTKLERQNHDATPKHQGNLKRFIRDLHRGHEKDAKDKERAKSEVARLNGLVSGSSAGESSSVGLGWGSRPSTPKSQTTSSERKQQLSQLAEMGVSIPEEFRGEMAMAGEWQVTSERIIAPSDAERNSEAIGIGIRKRTVQDEEEGALEIKRRRWGSNYLAHPQGDDGDLDALLTKPITKGKATALYKVVKQESPESMDREVKVTPNPEACEAEILGIKKEPFEEEVKLSISSSAPTDIEGKREGDGSVMFKKRARAKNIRQK